MSELSQQSRNKGRLFILLAAALWALAGVCVKSIQWGSLSIVCARSLLSFFVLAAYRKSFKIRITKVNVLGALMMTATGMLYMEAIKLTAAGTAIVLQYSAPIYVFLFGVIFKHRKAAWYEALITVIVFCGIVLSFADSLNGKSLLGSVLGLLSGFTFAGQILVMNKEDADSSDSLMLSCIISFVISLPFAVTDQNLVFDTKNILWVLILGIFQYGLANTCFSIGIRSCSAVESSLLLTLEPILNPIFVALVCGEVMGPTAVAGAIIVVVALLAYSLIPALLKKQEKV